MSGFSLTVDLDRQQVVAGLSLPVSRASKRRVAILVSADLARR